MSNRDDDVAEILGWTSIKMGGGARRELVGYDSLGVFDYVPRFTTDPSADYMVLEWVMAHDRKVDTTYALFGMFSKTLIDILLPRSYMQVAVIAMLFYKPGDYSHALLALKDKGLI